MKKSFAALVFLLVLSSLAWTAPLRDAVCIVKSELSEKTTVFLKSYRDSMRSQGYRDYADSIDAYLEGTFGSGFVYQGANGKKYVITNRHVVDCAESVTVQFEKEDGSYDTLSGLKILAVDDELDVAVIELTSSFNKASLSVSSASVDDGDDVWTAGFPGLGGKPAWQFGKGTVTNAVARIDELVPSSVSTIIQHSAQVDGGNSGGPLLVKDSKSAYGYSVVGINTWKATNRENTNFAIPMKSVKTFVDNAIAGKNKNLNINERLVKFNEALAFDEQTYDTMGRFVSNDMVSSLSSNTFIKILNSVSKSNQEVVVEHFVYDPIDGIRYAIAAYVWQRFRNNGKLIEYTSGAPEANGESYTVKFTVSGKKEYNSIWITEQGMWKLADFDSLVSNGGDSVKSSGISFSNPYTFSLGGGVSAYPFNVQDFSVILTMYMSDFIGYSFMYSSDTFPTMKFNTASVTVNLGLPVSIGPIIVEPNGSIGYSVLFEKGGSAFDFTFGFVYSAGVEVIYDTGSIGPFIGLQYTGKAYKPDPFGDEWSGRDVVDLSVGVKLGRASSFKLW